MSNNQSIQKILLDTSFLLPTLGIDVGDRVAKGIASLRSKSFYLYYSELSLLEANWIAVKHIKQRQFVQELFETGIVSIVQSGMYKAVTPNEQAYSHAIELFQMGHGDMIDNVLYASSVQNGMSFLTVDDELARFLESSGLKYNLVFPEDLLKR